ncbi:hypothetical protein FRB90_005979 [Tulasnella sp. 427]|nr:hypothetical protein FRB90_005979 [Tulasnella sp. 427]
MELAFNYFFGPTLPTPDQAALGAREMLFVNSGEAYNTEPASYVLDLIACREADVVVDRYIELARKATKLGVFDAECTWNVLTHLALVPPIQRQLFKEGKGLVPAMEVLWREPESLISKTWFTEVPRLGVLSISHILRLLDVRLMSSVVHDLIRHDFILLLGRVLFDWEKVVEFLGHIRPIYTQIYDQLKSHADMGIAQPHWAHVWRRLNAAARSAVDPDQTSSWVVASKFWLEFGRLALKKTQGLGLLQDYFKYIRRLEDIHHPALAAFWVSHLFDELIELLSTPLTRSKAQQEHIELYCTALECMKNIVDATWSPNSQAISYLWECTPAILLEQKNAYQKAINPLKSRLREQLIEVFGSLTVDHREDGPILSEREPLDKEFLLTLVYDLYFEPQVPPHWFITVYRARQILFDLAPDSYGAEPYPYVKNIVYWGGEHNIVRRYIGLAHSAGRTAPLDAETAWHILTDLSMVKSMQKRLFKQSSAHVVTMSLYWQDLRREDKRGIESPDDETARMVLASINHIIKMLDDNLRPAVIRDLVQDDLILVFGRALFTEEDLTTWISQ